jgi:hypothetical protein
MRGKMSIVSRRKSRWRISASTLLAILAFGASTRAAGEPQSLRKVGGSDNQCRVCHTDVKRLIRLGWEVEKIKPRPKSSAKTAGEG